MYNMFCFKFGLIEVESKYFHNQRQVTKILTIDVKKAPSSLIECHAIIWKTGNVL